MPQVSFLDLYSRARPPRVRPSRNPESETTALSVGQSKPSTAELLAEDPILLPEIVENDGSIMAVPIETEPEFQYGTAQLLFEGNYAQVFPGFDVSPDGQRFLMPKQSEGGTTELIVVENWFEELKRLVPTD